MSTTATNNKRTSGQVSNAELQAYDHIIAFTGSYLSAVRGEELRNCICITKDQIAGHEVHRMFDIVGMSTSDAFKLVQRFLPRALESELARAIDESASAHQVRIVKETEHKLSELVQLRSYLCSLMPTDAQHQQQHQQSQSQGQGREASSRVTDFQRRFCEPDIVDAVVDEASSGVEANSNTSNHYTIPKLNSNIVIKLEELRHRIPCILSFGIGNNWISNDWCLILVVSKLRFDGYERISASDELNKVHEQIICAHLSAQFVKAQLCTNHPDFCKHVNVRFTSGSEGANEHSAVAATTPGDAGDAAATANVPSVDTKAQMENEA